MLKRERIAGGVYVFRVHRGEFGVGSLFGARLSSVALRGIRGRAQPDTRWKEDTQWMEADGGCLLVCREPEASRGRSLTRFYEFYEFGKRRLTMRAPTYSHPPSQNG